MARRSGRGRSEPTYSGVDPSLLDYAAQVALAYAESSVRAPIEEMLGIVDVTNNRVAAGRGFNATKPGAWGVATAPRQYDPFSGMDGTKGARGSKNARAAARAIVEAIVYDRPLPSSVSRSKVSQAAAAVGHYAQGVGKGIAKGATFFSGTSVPLSRARVAEHNALGRQNAVQYGGTSFYGKQGFNPRKPDYDLSEAYRTAYDTPREKMGYAPAPREAYTVQPQDPLTQQTFDQIYEASPLTNARPSEPPATFDERYAPSGPMPPGSFGDFLGSYGTDHLIGRNYDDYQMEARPQAYGGIFPDAPPLPSLEYDIGPAPNRHEIEPSQRGIRVADLATDTLSDARPASAGFFNDRYEGDGLPMNSAAFGRPIGDYEFGSQAAPMIGPGSMAYGIDIGQTAPDPFAPEPAPDWFNDRLAEPSLYGSGFGLDTAMAGSRTTPMANSGVIGSEITPEYAPFVSEASQQILDSFPDYDHLGAPPMGGYTPPAPPQDYTAPPSMLASMDIGGSTADRLRSPSGYGSDYMTPGYARDEIETGRDRLAQVMAERFGATASAAIPQAPPQAPPRAPDPVSRFTERTVYDTKVVPETVTGYRDVPVERSFSKANVGSALGAKPTSFADLGFSMAPMTDEAWGSDRLKEQAQASLARADQHRQPAQTRREPYTFTRDKTVRTQRIERTPVPAAPIPTPTRPAMARPEVPSFTRPVSLQEMGINPIGAGSWGFNAFEPPAPSISQSFSMAGNSLLGGLSDSILSGLGYGPDSSFTGGWGMGWGDGGPGGYGGGSVYDGNSGPYGGGDARFDGGWGGMADSDTYR
jgi:hypothetical protein